MSNGLKDHFGEQVKVRVELTDEQFSSLQEAISDQVDEFSEVDELKKKRAELVGQAEELKWGVTPDELSRAKDLFYETFLDVDKHILYGGAVLDIDKYGVEFDASVEPTSAHIDFSSLLIGRLSIAAINVNTWHILASLALRENRPQEYIGGDEPDAEIGFIMNHEPSIQVVEGLVLPYENVLVEGSVITDALAKLE